MEGKEWFSTWFDSPYYHILYAKRDESEAADFIASLQQKLHLALGSRVLDAACGKGRHAITLQQLGFMVDAFDLSPSNIEAAQAFENKDLLFFVHDLREPLPLQNKYDAIFNFFTSFGYFDDQQDNQKAFNTFAGGLKENGLLVLDFFNPTYVVANLVPTERVERQGISFQIKRWSAAGYLYKSIDFSDQGKDFSFIEKVELVAKNDFISYAAQAGLSLVDLQGDYSLASFDEATSPRMIFTWTKKSN
ncbi:methyltransferase domain-containing protein [Aquirufa sp. HETE-83D]|uniref:Methyltransferase domain-containing protein n=1 Tax=Aquirufa esocilacus TaxID=3096513 RepID=A0ABW6DHK1_9BACT